MNIRLNPSAVKQTRWYEYLIRFVFGGLITVAAGLIAKKYGLVIGGLFLAFPSIFPASVTLVQKHKERKEEQQGEEEETSKDKGRQSAGITAQGAALGSAGLLGFAVVIWQLSLSLPPWLVLILALAVWVGINLLAFWGFQKTRGQQQEPGS